SSNIFLNSNIASPSGLSNIDNISENFANKLFELDSTNNNSNIFEIDPNTNILDSFKNSLHNYQEFPNELLNNSAFSKVNQSSSSDKKINQKYDEFPNETYANLIVLVTKYKLSNAIGNAIILFFNKH